MNFLNSIHNFTKKISIKTEQSALFFLQNYTVTGVQTPFDTLTNDGTKNYYIDTTGGNNDNANGNNDTYENVDDTFIILADSNNQFTQDVRTNQDGFSDQIKYCIFRSSTPGVSCTIITQDVLRNLSHEIGVNIFFSYDVINYSHSNQLLGPAATPSNAFNTLTIEVDTSLPKQVPNWSSRFNGSHVNYYTNDNSNALYMYDRNTGLMYQVVYVSGKILGALPVNSDGFLNFWKSLYHWGSNETYQWGSNTINNRQTNETISVYNNTNNNEPQGQYQIQSYTPTGRI